MKVETPAIGIMKTGEFGKSVLYHIRCECGNPDDAHDLEVEADEYDIKVHIYATVHTKWWEMKTWKQIWEILKNGHAEYQTTLVMNEQTAINYAETLKSAVSKMKEIRNEK